MTLYHFGNCLALIYGPYHMVYKFAGVSEYASFSKCVYAGMLYMFTQLCKMLLLATFFPDSDSGQAGGEYDVLLEILKATVDFADLIGLHFAMTAIPGKGHAKILTAAIGWASAEALVSQLVPLWVGARGAEFSWRHAAGAAQCSLALAAAAAAAAALWLRPRASLAPPARALVAALLLVAPYRPLLEEAACGALRVSAGGALLVRAALTAAHALLALAAYAHADH